MSSEEVPSWVWPQHIIFLHRGDDFFYVDEFGEWHKVVQCTHIANGDRALCIVKRDDEVFPEFKTKVLPKDEVFNAEGDLVLFDIEPGYGKKKRLITVLSGENDELLRVLRKIKKYYFKGKLKKGFLDAGGIVY